MKATGVLAMVIDEASAKVRAAPPGDDPGDETWPIWGGVLPVHTVPGPAEPDQYVAGRLEAPATPFVRGRNGKVFASFFKKKCLFFFEKKNQKILSACSLASRQVWWHSGDAGRSGQWR